jgi:hypothetical protein
VEIRIAYESLAAEREHVRKIPNIFSPSWYSSVTEEYQVGENSYCEFFGLVPFLQLAIHTEVSRKARTEATTFEK